MSEIIKASGSAGLVPGGSARGHVLVDLARGVRESFKVRAAILRERGDEESAQWVDAWARKIGQGLSGDHPAVRLKAGEATVSVDLVDVDGTALLPPEITVLCVLGGSRLLGYSLGEIVSRAKTIGRPIEKDAATKARRKLIGLKLAKPVKGKDGATLTRKGEIVYRELEGID